MFKLLESNQAMSWILVAVVVVALIGMMFFGRRTNAKNMQMRQELVSKFQKGTKIITNQGIYGTILEIKETTHGKVALISTGDKGHETHMLIHLDAIMNIDDKKDIVYDANGNDITEYDDKSSNPSTPNEIKEKTKETIPTTETLEVSKEDEISVEKSDEINQELTSEKEIKPKKSSSKKASTKKSTK